MKSILGYKGKEIGNIIIIHANKGSAFSVLKQRYTKNGTRPILMDIY